MSLWNSCLGDVRYYLEFPSSSSPGMPWQWGWPTTLTTITGRLYTVYPAAPVTPRRYKGAGTLLSLPARDNAGPEGHFKSVGLSTDVTAPIRSYVSALSMTLLMGGGEGRGAIWMRNSYYTTQPPPTAQRGFVFMLPVFSRLLFLNMSVKHKYKPRSSRK